MTSPEIHGLDLSPVVILNASPEPSLRELRSKVLHEAGYHTDSAATPEEVIKLASQLNCSVVVVCHCFSARDRLKISTLLKQSFPNIELMVLKSTESSDPRAFLCSLKGLLLRRVQKLAG